MKRGAAAQGSARSFGKNLLLNGDLMLLMLPVVAYYVIFSYIPMAGIVIAFKEYRLLDGIWGSPWVGLKQFEVLFQTPSFFEVLRNTVVISALRILFGFPAPILLALLLNELGNERFKRVVQSIVYLPHFISLVVICGMIRTFVARNGIITELLTLFGFPRTNLLGDPRYFRTVFVASGVWQTIGWNSIVYLSALTAVSPDLYESATIDGANRLQKTLYITLPSITPTIVTMFILRLGQIMSVGSEKILLLYNPNTYEVADVISTYVYRVGLSESFQPSYSTAVGLFSSVINFALILIANSISKKATESSLW